MCMCVCKKQLQGEWDKKNLGAVMKKVEKIMEQRNNESDN